MSVFKNISKKVRSVFLLGLVVLLVQGCQEDSNKPFQEGVHYRVLKGIDKSDSKQVILFFSAACPHCKKFDGYLKDWEQQRASDVAYERIPATFSKKEWALLSKMYAVGRQLNEQDKVVDALFKSIQEERTWWSQDYQIIQWFGDLGFDLQTVDDLWRGTSTVELMKRYSNSESRYAVRSIPRLIINGKYELLPKAFENEDAKEGTEAEAVIKTQIRDAINYILTI
jgi:thiol:disulfide interchange protein DsbA